MYSSTLGPASLGLVLGLVSALFYLNYGQICLVCYELVMQLIS